MTSSLRPSICGLSIPTVDRDYREALKFRIKGQLVVKEYRGRLR